MLDLCLILSKPLCLALALLLFLALPSPALDNSPSLQQARKNFPTKLSKILSTDKAPEEPPAGVLELVTYPAPLGNNAAYRSPDPQDGKKYPAVIWLSGGFSNSIGRIAWTPGPPENDQSAAGFRRQGIIMLYPSLRGGNNNPGSKESFFGEVDDVLAAVKYLASLDYVDPSRIYLGGHSTGATLALLVAETDPYKFRAVFALGPVENPAGYGQLNLNFDLNNAKELGLRSPGKWLSDLACPTYIFEGTEENSNIDSLQNMQKACKNPEVNFIALPGQNHFNIIAPLVEQISQSILLDPKKSKQFEYDFSKIAN